jgi:Tol biopolymer transport system component
MTSFERFENRIPMLLEELAVPSLPAYADDLFARTAATRQRAGWTFLERWPLLSTFTGRLAAVPHIPWRLGLAGALLLAAVIIGLLVVGSHLFRVPAPFGPAANGAIVYASAGDLYLGNPADGQTRLLVGGPENDRLPWFSPDGTKIAFVRDEPGTAADLMIRIFVMRADGSGLKQVTSEPLRDADVPWLSWTPDGRLALVHNVDGVNQLDIVDDKGSAPIRLAAAAGVTELRYRPPDGGEILFRACHAHSPAGDGDCGLYRMDADGSNVRQLAQPATTDDTLDLTSAVYSADGSQIFMNRWTSDASFGSPGCCHLFVMNADGTGQRVFIPNTFASGVWDGNAVVAPDGTRVAFTHNSNPGVSVVRTDDTGTIVQTGPRLSGLAHWAWSPDSSKILMYPDDGSSTKAFLLDPDGGPWTTVPWDSGGDLDWQRLAP